MSRLQKNAALAELNNRVMNIPTLRLEYFPNTTVNKLHVLGNRVVIEKSDDDSAQITTLCIYGSRKNILSSFNFADSLSTFKHLNVLSIPAFLIGKLKEGDIPNSVSILRIDITEDMKPSDTNLTWPNITLLNVKSIIFSFSSTSIPLDSLLGITPSNFPNLEYLNCRIDKKGTILNSINLFKTLKFLEVEYVGNNSLFKSISSQLKVLIIVGADSKFQLNDISYIQSLEMILLNGFKSEIDCSIFPLLPKLNELAIWNSRKILDIEALLDCKQLKTISVINCGNPFKKVRHKFNDNYYENLDIKYS